MSSTLNQTSDKFDELLLDILTNGTPLVDASGAAVLVDGKPVMGRPSAAVLNVIRARLKDAGIASDASQAASPIAKLSSRLQEEERAKGRKLPALTDDPDSAVA